MKKFKTIFTLLILGLFMLSSTSAFARKPPNGVYNYVDSNSHLWVWYENHYVDMGIYVFGPPCDGNCD